jgi:ribosomal protein S4E
MNRTSFKLGCDRGFLFIPGTRVFVTGTRHHGMRGKVVETPTDWPARAQAVQLDEFNESMKFFRHNLIPMDSLNASNQTPPPKA